MTRSFQSQMTSGRDHNPTADRVPPGLPCAPVDLRDRYGCAAGQPEAYRATAADSRRGSAAAVRTPVS